MEFNKRIYSTRTTNNSIFFNCKAEWTIPFVLWGLGIIFVILWFCIVAGKGFTTVIFFNGIVQGTLVAAVAVFGNQLFKQFTDKRIVDNEHLYDTSE